MIYTVIFKMQNPDMIGIDQGEIKSAPMTMGVQINVEAEAAAEAVLKAQEEDSAKLPWNFVKAHLMNTVQDEQE